MKKGSITRYDQELVLETIADYDNAEISAWILEPVKEQIGGGGSDINLELIDTFETTLEAYTNTSSWETTSTGISINDFPYAVGIAVVTCDGTITASDWGMTVALIGHNNNGRFSASGSGQLELKGSKSFDLSAFTEGFISTSYGVLIENNISELKFSRKANSSLPTIRGGKYTVKLYGIKS